MRYFQAEFIIFVFFLSFILFLILNDFEIRASEKIFEDFSVERNDQNSQRNETINFKIETQPVRDPRSVTLVRSGPMIFILVRRSHHKVFEKREIEPKRIIFIKTHKTGSSTIQNIFYRYALGQIASFDFAFLAMSRLREGSCISSKSHRRRIFSRDGICMRLLNSCSKIDHVSKF